MVPETKYRMMKAKLVEVKQLFQTRHYAQCATLCEQLTRVTDEVCFPRTVLQKTSSNRTLMSLTITKKCLI
jgi:hypothetical protein